MDAFADPTGPLRWHMLKPSHLPEEQPRRLYRYRSPTPYDFEAVARSTLWCTAPVNFNDPYDCALGGLVDLGLDALLELAAITGPSMASMYKTRQRTFPPPSVRAALMGKVAAETFANWVRSVRTERGVTCFAKSPGVPLLWAHYTNGHRGFCLEFDTQYEPFASARPVNYCAHKPSIDLRAFVVTDGKPIAAKAQQFNDLTLLAKAHWWQYEGEWRIINERGGVPIRYDPHALTGVLLGSCVTQETVAAIKAAVAGRPVSLQRCTGMTSEFELTFEPLAD